MTTTRSTYSRTAIHIAAAIKHHVWNGDNMVERMLPLLRAREEV